MKETKRFLNNMKWSGPLTALLIAAAIPSISQAEAGQCGAVFQIETQAQEAKREVVKLVNSKEKAQTLREQLETNYKARNEVLAKRYPQLEYIFKDPEAFVQTMKQRFEAQKRITPEDPRLFDFPEAATTMKDIRADLETFRQEVAVDLRSSKDTFRNRLAHTFLGRRSSKVETLSKTLSYIHKLQRDLDVMIESNHYPYRDTVYTLYYYSRIRGIFQFKDLSTYYQVAKYIDMSMHGYRRLNIDAELNLYKAKESPIIQVRSGKIAHEFRVAEVPFRESFERLDTLDFVIIPSTHALGSSAFMHVLPHKIHFLGATNTPVPADGFNRPGGLFWMHDVRHEADRFMKMTSYRKANNMTAKQEETMALLSQQWQADFLKLKNSITDPELKASVEHYHFYTHHDVGVPLVPSMFLSHHKDGMAVYYAFLFHKRNAGQEIGFKNWFANTRKTQEILTKFWQERLPLEQQLLRKEPVHITKWEDWFPMTYKLDKSQVSVLNRAVESGSLVRLQTDMAGVDGALSKVIYSKDGAPIFVQFSGAARLLDRASQELPGQGVSVHSQGYSSPIGAIKQMTADGIVKSEFSQIRENQMVEIQYESGIIVKGQMKGLTRDESGAVNVVTFKTAEAVYGEQMLYKPEWGSFDLMIGSKIQSFEFLN